MLTNHLTLQQNHHQHSPHFTRQQLLQLRSSHSISIAAVAKNPSKSSHLSWRNFPTNNHPPNPPHHPPPTAHHQKSNQPIRRENPSVEYFLTVGRMSGVAGKQNEWVTNMG